MVKIEHNMNIEFKIIPFAKFSLKINNREIERTI